jgi:hypothetical protein
MANGDPLLVGVGQPPDNRASAATMLVHTGSVFGTQSNSFWVQRVGAPVGTAAVRGDNFSTGTKGGQTIAGVMGMINAPGGDVGVLGAASGQLGLMWGEIGVMGVTNSFGVVGQGLGGLLEQDGEFIGSSVGVQGECDDGIGVQGVATNGFGVVGRSNSRAGVTGTSDSDAGVEGDSMAGVGVLGQSANTVGVWGSTTSGFAGVRGSASQGYGVFGESARVAVLGQSPTNAVQGVSNGPAAASIGVVGISDNGSGVQGMSTLGAGGWFTGRAGVVGVSDQGYAVVGKSAQGGAGLFYGRVLIQGSLQVTGAKNAVVKHTDGSHRALFCVESAESMLQDFGEVTLKGASVFVKFARDFAPLIKRNNYQVFLTTYGPEAVYVRKRTRDGFEIARHLAQAGTKADSVVVGYCIVGRRADLKSTRLPRVKLPAPPAELVGPKIQKPTTPSALVKRQKPGATALPPRPKISTPNLKQLAKSAPRTSAKRKKTRT